jgi:hypothetical protein
MIGDTEDVDQAFLAQLRSLNVVFVPVLSADEVSHSRCGNHQAK